MYIWVVRLFSWPYQTRLLKLIWEDAEFENR
jgi:hypothetical protein